MMARAAATALGRVKLKIDGVKRKGTIVNRTTVVGQTSGHAGPIEETILVVLDPLKYKMEKK